MFSKAKLHFQLPVKELVSQVLARGAGRLNDAGALVISTGEFTGRSPADKFIVKDTVSEAAVQWNKFNNPMAEKDYAGLKTEMISYLDRRDELWMRNAVACARPEHQLNLRIITEDPASDHFAANMFIASSKVSGHDWTIIHAPGFKADPVKNGTRQGNFTIISFKEQTILIGGSGYTGEIKKSVFSVLNFILPLRKNILSMHCSANEGANGDCALFFGLSGTGKTTLSSDASRKLIGDDEHGWDDRGIFNLEGGCYAKIINLSKVNEPEIFNAIRGGALVENTSFISGTSVIDFASSKVTENTRVSYPLNFISNIKKPSVSGIPKNIFFLTCDAYGIFPPISKLDKEQAMYFFINGYTAKIAGTENGVKEPQATFSACFGAPFLPLAPAFYAALLQQKLEENSTNVWMVNTGWTAGDYGSGRRIPLLYTRAMITAALNGLEKYAFSTHSFFNLEIPLSCPGVPAAILDPGRTWPDQNAYQRTRALLSKKFDENYKLYK
jgi:phosphoenolpyruvate carboxykinase (ATP)